MTLVSQSYDQQEQGDGHGKNDELIRHGCMKNVYRRLLHLTGNRRGEIIRESMQIKCHFN